MNLEEMKRRKKELGITNQQLADFSGVPVGTVNKIFSGATKSPQHDTVVALEAALGMYVSDLYHKPEDGRTVRESRAAYYAKRDYRAGDYYALPDHIRMELIDGQLYYMASPGRLHQELLTELLYRFKGYIAGKKGPCRIYPAPFDVRLDRDDRTIVQPDISIVCHPDRLTEQGIDGAPDFVLEIISASTGKKDYSLKLQKYWDAGVREYWIVDPIKKRIVTYQFHEEDMNMKIYGIHDPVPVGIYEDLVIDFSEFDLWSI